MKRGESNNLPKILCFDPSLTAWGYALVEPRSNRVELTGCIKTEPGYKKLRIRVGDDRCRRIDELVCLFREIINRNEVKLIVSEQPHGSQSASAAIMIGIALSIVQTISTWTGIPVEWYMESECKKILTGLKAVTKTEIINAIREKYDVPWDNVKYRDEAVADSLAVYYAAEQRSEIIKFMKL